MEVYRESKSAIISIMSELNVMPLSEFEKLVCNEGTTFRPTKENMIALRVCNFTVYICIFSRV
jgi:hypothetical protein